MPDKQDVILVELESVGSGVRGVAAFSLDQLREKSAEAADKIMDTMRAMSSKVVASLKEIKISERPTKVEVEFGIKVNAEGDAVVAKAGAEAAVKVTLTWEHKEYDSPAQSK